MAKISGLDALETDNLDGTEQLPVVKGGAMHRTSADGLVGKLAQPYVAQASNAVVSAQALVNSRTTLAQALADFAVGDLFSTADDTAQDGEGSPTNPDGELRVYQRIADAPGYTDLGDAFAPIAKAAAASNTPGRGLSLFGMEGGGTGQDLANRTAFPTLETARLLDLDPAGIVNRIQTADRGTYEKVDAATPEQLADGSAIVDARGWVWAQVKSRIMSAREMGIVPHTDLSSYGRIQGAIVDQSGKLQRAFYQLAEHGGGELVFDEGMLGVIAVEETVVRPLGTSMRNLYHQGNTDELEGLKFCSTENGTYHTRAGTVVSFVNDGSANDGCMFFDNAAKEAPGTWIKPYPNALAAYVKGVMIDGRASGGISGFHTAAPNVYESLRGWDIATLISKPAVYMDQLKIDGVNVAQRSSATHFLIDLGDDLGDGLYIGGVHSNYTSTGQICNNILVGTCRGGIVALCINGIIRAVGSDALTIEACHGEGHQVQIDAANVTIKANHFHNGKNLPTPIDIANSNADRGDQMVVRLEGNSFVHFAGPSGGGAQGWAEGPCLDADIRSPGIRVYHDGTNVREASFSGQVGRRIHMMPVFGDSTRGGQFEAFKYYGHVIGHKPGSIWNTSDGAVIEVTGTARSALEPWYGLTEVKDFKPTKANVVFLGETAIYEYHVTLVQDYPRKIAKLPANNAIATRAATNGAQLLPEFTIGQAASTRGPRTYKIERRIAGGQFTKFCFVTSFGFTKCIDNGKAINSIPWEDMPASPLEDFNFGGFAGRIRYTDGQAHVLDATVTTVPAYGDWQRGDVVNTPNARPDAATNTRLKSRSLIDDGDPETDGTEWVAEYVLTQPPAA